MNYSLRFQLWDVFCLFKFVAFAMHLDIAMSKYITKATYLEKSKTCYNIKLREYIAWYKTRDQTKYNASTFGGGGRPNFLQISPFLQKTSHLAPGLQKPNFGSFSRRRDNTHHRSWRQGRRTANTWLVTWRLRCGARHIKFGCIFTMRWKILIH